ncbi:hypothetical protein HC864_02025 [Candidatus Gracilibacteria bacterium]|nr:hypothetical protein [Candidatus Gracilibacteria bacterium]
MFNYPEHKLNLKNNGTYFNYTNAIKSELMVNGVIQISNKNNFLSLSDFDLDRIFGIYSQLISTEFMYTLIQHLPKDKIGAFWIFDYYVLPLKKLGIKKIPISYYFFCFWDILSTFSIESGEELSNKIEIIIVNEFLNNCYFFEGQRLKNSTSTKSTTTTFNINQKN